MSTRKKLVAALLAAGILSSLVYVATDWLAAVRWEGYRIADRMVSELIAVGSPTRDFVLGPMLVYNALVVAFGIGVWMAARKRSTKWCGTALLAYGAASWLGLLAFPLKPESGGAAAGGLGLNGLLHSVITLVTVLLIFVFIGLGSGAGGRWFRLYSILTILVVLAGGVLAGTQIPAAAKGLPTPGVGVTERANIYAMMLWIAVLAVLLLRDLRETAPVPSGSAENGRSSKKVLALVGSAHKGGATYTAARKLLDELEAFGDVDGEIVVLSDYEIGTCRGCKSCFNRGENTCPLKDDRDVLLGKMHAADGIVWASPNYSWQVSGYMKVFLDRIGFVFHRPAFHGKTATAVVVQGVAFGGRVRKYLEFCSGGLGCKVVKGSVIQTLQPMTEKALGKMDRALVEQARRYHEELLRPAFPTPSLLQLMLFRASRTGIKLHAPRELHDWAYYRDKGWFESDYYYPVTLGVAKRAAGALFDWVGARMTTFQVAKPADAGGAHPA